MKLVGSNLDRRKFLKLGSMALVTPLVLKASHLVSLTTAKTAHAATKVSAAYNRAIDKMVEGFKERASTMIGWGRGRGSATVTSQQLINSAHVTYNPFWTNEGYASGTRWGGLIAYPMYGPSGGNMLTTVPWETPETGYDRQLWPGQDWEFYQPVHVGDTLRVWNRAPAITEQEAPDRGGIRGFLVKEGDYDVINQRNEIVTSTQNYTVRIFFPDGPPGPPYIWQRYGFTEEEIFYLDRLARSEKVRGKEIRYYEDVNVGDRLDPVVIGPTNMNDIGAQGSGGMPAGAGPGELAAAAMGEGTAQQGPINKLLEKEDVIGQEEYIKGTTGLYYKGGGGGMRHWDDIVAQAEGEPGAFLWGNMSIRCMLCCLTNWIGDDAFVRKYSWRHVTRTLVGDASYASGKVTNKRRENGEYLVDIFICQRDIRGFVVDAAVATVALRSKTDPYPDVKKVIDY